MAENNISKQNSSDLVENHNDVSPSLNSHDKLTNEMNNNANNNKNYQTEDYNYRNGNLDYNNSFKSDINSHNSSLNGDYQHTNQDDQERLNSKEGHLLDTSVQTNGNVEEQEKYNSENHLEQVDDNLLNDIERTLHHHDKSDNTNSLFIDMSKVKDTKSKSGSHRTESLRSRHSSKSHESSERSKKKSSRKLHQFGTSENPLDITEMTVDCGSLLELYQNDYFDAFMHMYHLYHKKEAGVHEYLVNMLYTKRTNDEILFYLPQLCQLSISKYGKSSLHRFLLDKASVSMHFALQLSWFYQAAIDDQIPKYDRLTQKMTQDTEMAVVNCKLISPSSFSRPSPEMPIPEKLSFPCLLDRRLLLQSLSKLQNSKEYNSKDICTNVNSLLTPQMPHSMVHNTFGLSSPVSKVELEGVHNNLGNPLDFETHPILDYNGDLHLELQKLMMKQRRLNYFNSITIFVHICIQNSSRLTTETKREAREPLLKVFVNALNEWMLLRRCTVAAYEESFAYTGLSLPFHFMNNPQQNYNYRLNGIKNKDKNDQVFSQILRIVESETKIFFSKKRAPFVFYVEMANLDEDIESISSNKDNRQFSMRDLYVFDSIVDDLLSYDLLTQTQVESIKNPLECIRFALDMLPNESLERYKNLLDDKADSSCGDNSDSKTPISDDSFSVSRVSSSNNTDDNMVLDEESYSESDSKNNNEDNMDVDNNNNNTRDKEVDKDEDNKEKEEYENEENNEVKYDETKEDKDNIEVDKHYMETLKLNVDRDNKEYIDNNTNNKDSNTSEDDSQSSDTTNLNETISIHSNESQSPRYKDDINLKLNDNNNNYDNKTTEKDTPTKDGIESNKESSRDKESKYPDVKKLSPKEVRNIIFPETFEQKKERIRRDSPYGLLKSWDLCAFVVKGNDDLRQEKMANQVLESFKRIFTKAKLPLWLRPIEILVTGSNSGIMEFIHDTYSVDVIKRKFNVESLAPVFEKLFYSNIYEARKNFIESHAAYSIVSYLLQVKDRHNGNILLDPEGHVIHIDYGFCLSNFPGKLISFETSPFKLTKEYLDVIGGGNSDNFVYFKTLVIKGLLEARKHVDEIVLLVEMMSTANKMPCFLAGTSYTIEMFKERFMLNQSEETCIRKITEMIDASVNSFSTVQYDTYQRLTNGIM